MRPWNCCKWGISVLFLLSCTEREQEAGRPGVDETSNGISAQIFAENGIPAAKAKVVRLTCEFGAQVDTTLIADSVGQVVFDTLGWNGELCLDIRTQNEAIKLAYRRGDSLSFDSVVLQKFARVRGQVELPPSQTHAFLEIRGLAGKWKTKRSGSFEIDSIPAGSTQIRAMLIDTPLVISESQTELSSGATQYASFVPVPQDSSAWRSSARITLNTKASGANLKEDLTNFPVLLTLADTSFPRGSSWGGADLRITNSSGREIPYEIVQWDSVARMATLWMRLDTLRKNDSLQSLRLRWGNPNALSVSAALQVFDSADGWSGVWHLSQSFLDSQGRDRTPDATPWQNDGVIHGLTNWSDSPLGRGLGFDGTPNAVAFAGSGVDLGRRSFTWELWMQSSQIGADLFHRGNIDTIWDPMEKRVFLGLPETPFVASMGWRPTFIGRGSPNIYVTCSTQVVAGEWTHLVLRRTVANGDSGISEWFINGVKVGLSSSMDLLEKDQASDSLYLGDELPGSPRILNGALAEFRISRVARSSEWIRMDHYQQIPENRNWIRIHN